RERSPKAISTSANGGVAGGISVWLCQTAAPFLDPAGLAKTCPQSGTVEGTITAANVIGPTGQGIAAGEFAELVRAIRGGVTYANVHSTKFPTGEIREQIKADDDDYAARPGVLGFGAGRIRGWRTGGPAGR